ncbi:hypothetical protein DPMN_185788 [Dreissena polymorpha]|uniref:Uncharacterized protein n=1 Tax=Dreissena polymorpha TaxID=45954 RepID=A0A9D4DL57_DREPO|nr:hypothetical protein DPMN_185788 [Dreissena polymorpha]
MRNIDLNPKSRCRRQRPPRRPPIGPQSFSKIPEAFRGFPCCLLSAGRCYWWSLHSLWRIRCRSSDTAGVYPGAGRSYWGSAKLQESKKRARIKKRVIQIRL